MKKFQKITLALLVAVSSFLTLAITPAAFNTNQVEAQNLLCDVFPFIGSIDYTSSLCGTGNIEGDARSAVSTVEQLIQLGVSLVFIGIIIIAVGTIIKAAVVYIRSEGNEGKIQESQKAIKSVFIGIGALIIGIIGLVIVLAIFNAGEAVGGGGSAGDAVDILLGKAAGGGGGACSNPGVACAGGGTIANCSAGGPILT
ncbi:MAG: hypothetical protein Q9M91_05780 [Candidatus Dojkabacteria bacterium]|nr:hypothetical protein [Candidatus Dojkabacteria bacterium]MDQ7021309.1 hypothetical protein [Candidatus Dojkabacteria bacterium]